MSLDVSDEEVSLIAMRSMLGRLLEVKRGCPCGLRQVPVGEVLAAGDEGPRC